MKKLSLLLFLIIVFQGFNLFAQNSILGSVESKKYSEEWIMYKSLELVDIYYKYCDCSDAANGFYPEKVLFKFENKTKDQVYVYWTYSTSFDNEISEGATNEKIVNIILAPNEIKEGDCETSWNTKLGVIVGSKVQDYKFSGLEMTDIREFKLN